MTEPTTPDTVDDRARPGPKPRKDWQANWLAVYAEKGTVSTACKAVGISRQTAYDHRKRDAEFAAAWDRQENAVTDQLEKTLVEIALEGSGSPQIRALEFALKARRPHIYREGLKVEHSGSIAVPKAVEDAVNEEIESAHAEIERLTERLANVADRGEAAPPGESEAEPVAAGG